MWEGGKKSEEEWDFKEDTLSGALSIPDLNKSKCLAQGCCLCMCVSVCGLYQTWVLANGCVSTPDFN